MKRLIAAVVIACMVGVTGCSLVNISKDDRQYRRDVGTLPKDKELSFPSKEAMAAGAALANVTAAQGYYEGFPAKSKESKILYDLTYRFMGLCGVNMAFDPSDPESVKKVFENADNAIKEKDKNIHDLKQDLAAFKDELATKEKIVRDKGEEMKRYRSTWHWRFGAIFWGGLAAVILIGGGLFAVQVYTGIPVFSMAVGLITGGAKTIFKVGKQTASAIEEWKGKRDAEIAQLRAAGREPEAQAMEKARAELSVLLGNHQDADVKAFIAKKFLASKPTNGMATPANGVTP